MSQASQAIFQGISLLLTQRRTAEARAELERLLALDPDDPEARAQAGDVYAYTGAHSAAYKQYNQAAETYNRMGRADLASAVHHKILELDLLSLDSATQTRLRLLGLLVAAEDAIAAGQLDKAVAGYQEAIRQFPNHTISYQRLAGLLVRLDRVAEAAEQYLVVARAFYAHGVRGKARPYFEQVLELKPEHSEALELLLVCLAEEKTPTDGARFVRAAVQTLLRAGDAGRARTVFGLLATLGVAVQAEPLEAALLLQSGEAVLAEQCAARLRPGEAATQALFKDLGRSALQRNDRVQASVYARWAQGRAEASQAAAQELPSASFSVPQSGPRLVPVEDQPAMRTLGEVCLAEGLFDQASRVFERLAASRPDYPIYAELLKRARAGSGASASSADDPGSLVTQALPLAGPRPFGDRLLGVVPKVAPTLMFPLQPTGSQPLAVPSPVPVLPALKAILPSPTALESQAVPNAVPPVLPSASAAPAPLSGVVPPLAQTVSSPGVNPPPSLAAPVRPVTPAKVPYPGRVAVRPLHDTEEASAAPAIVRTAYVMSLGEIPPVSIGPLDDSDELIE